MKNLSSARIVREMTILRDDPPPGVMVWLMPDSMHHLQASLSGPENTAYENGNFVLDIMLSDQYPMEPPSVRFVSRIFHPNVDSSGRICLDTLKAQPIGSWSPAVNLHTLLTTIRVLIGQPNADDSLMPEIADLYRRNPEEFNLIVRRQILQATKDATKAIQQPITVSETDGASEEAKDSMGKRKIEESVATCSIPTETESKPTDKIRNVRKRVL